MVARSSQLILVLALLVTAALTRATQTGSRAADAGTAASAAARAQPALVVLNYYYARPGHAEEVYRWRLHASDIREKLGLARGRVLRRTSGAEASPAADLPDVVWQCDYANEQARAVDLARLDASPEFAAVEEHMGTLLRDFRRELFQAEPAR